jgi:hypothetical protein
VLAHGSGTDEFLIFIFPVVFGLGLWRILKQKKTAEEKGPVGLAETAAPGLATPLPRRRKDGAAHLHAVLHQEAGREGSPVKAQKVRRRRLNGPARLRLLVSGEGSDADALPAED